MQKDCLEVFPSTVVFQCKTFWRWRRCEGSDLMIRLIPLWMCAFIALMNHWEIVNPYEEVGHWGHAYGRRRWLGVCLWVTESMTVEDNRSLKACLLRVDFCPWFLLSSVLPRSREMRSFALPCPSCHAVLPLQRPQNNTKNMNNLFSDMIKPDCSEVFWSLQFECDPPWRAPAPNSLFFFFT